MVDGAAFLPGKSFQRLGARYARAREMLFAGDQVLEGGLGINLAQLAQPGHQHARVMRVLQIVGHDAWRGQRVARAQVHAAA